MARTPTPGTQRTQRTQRTQPPRTYAPPAPPPGVTPDGLLEGHPKDEWLDRFVKFLVRPRGGRAALEALVARDDAAGVVGFDVDCVDVVAHDAELLACTLRHPKVMVPVLDDALAEAQDRLLASASAAGRDDWRPRRAKARLRCVPPLPEHWKANVSSLRASDVGKLVQVCGTVVRAGAVKIIESCRTYQCGAASCGATFAVYADREQGNLLEKPTRCPGANGCGGCSSRRFVEVGRENADYQEVRLQEHVEQLAVGSCVGSIPRAVTVVLEHDLADSVQAGDRVSVVGWLERKWKPCYRDVRCDVEVVLVANGVRVGAASTAGAARVTAEDRAAFRALWADATARGRPLAARDAVATRAGKSQFLRFAAKVAPRCVVTTGCGTTSAGLTCSAVKDARRDAEAGRARPRGRGVCCIDEFSAINPRDRAAIHEAMEQQTLSVAKAGLVCKLSAATVIAVTNPGASDDPAERGGGGARGGGGGGARRRGPTPGPRSGCAPTSRTSRRRSRWRRATRASALLEAYYSGARRRGGGGRATIRMLESLVRVAQAHARLMHRDVASTQDAVVAVLLVDKSMMETRS
ncbi:DNA replication licensing factor [Aureococcus anophagefferens]|uniref:DNA helicase n=1 Tax=Aureococcus anophagefferens TaxID=44056 RepID=A0ABR1FXP7_AURAN